MVTNNSCNYQPTNHSIQVGSTNGALSNLAASATAGQPVISNGTAPVYGTASVAGGGTGATTLTGILTGNGTSPVTANAVTQNGVLVGGASNAASSTSVGATGTVLAGNTAAAPTFQTIQSLSGWQYLIKVQPSSGSSIIDLTPYTSTYSRFLLMGRGLFPNGGGDIYLLVSLDGSTYETTQYLSGYNFWNFDSTTYTNVNSTAEVLLGSAHASGQGWGLSFECFIDVSLTGGPAGSTNSNHFYGSSISVDVSHTVCSKFDLSATYYNTTPLEAIQVTSGSGLANHGSITLYGMMI